MIAATIFTIIIFLVSMLIGISNQMNTVARNVRHRYEGTNEDVFPMTLADFGLRRFSNTQVVVKVPKKMFD